MKNSEELRQQLRSINRKSYPAYKGLKSLYHFGNYILSIDHVQGRSFLLLPLMSAFRFHTEMPDFPSNIIKIHLPGLLFATILHVSLKNRSVSTAFVQKAPAKAACSLSVISGQEILSRTACEITEKGITARFLWASLLMAERSMPLNWRKSFFDFFLPVCIQKSFFYSSLNAKELQNYIELAEDQEFIRQTLKEKKSLRIHSRRLHPPKRKRYFLPPYESFRSLHFSGQSAHVHKSSP